MRDAVSSSSNRMNSGFNKRKYDIASFHSLFLRILDTLEKCRRLRKEIISHDGMVQEAENLLYGKKNNVDDNDKSYLILTVLIYLYLCQILMQSKLIKLCNK